MATLNCSMVMVFSYSLPSSPSLSVHRSKHLFLKIIVLPRDGGFVASTIIFFSRPRGLIIVDHIYLDLLIV